MRIIITGGTGSIGTTLANFMQERGDEVIVLTRNPDTRPSTLAPDIQVIGWDAKTGNGWSQQINAETVIVNLAGKNPANWRWTPAHKQAVLESRLNAAKAVIHATEHAPAKPLALMQASAVGYYGETGDRITTEASPAGDTWRASVCVDWEAMLKPLEAGGIRVAYLRISNVFDPSGGALPQFMNAANLMGRQLGDGEQWVPWIHKEDVSRAIAYLIDNEGLSGAFNLTSPQPVTNRTLMQTLTSVIGRPSIFPVPAFALKLALGEMAKVVLDSQRIVPHRLSEAGFEFAFPTLEPALQDLLQSSH